MDDHGNKVGKYEVLKGEAKQEQFPMSRTLILKDKEEVVWRENDNRYISC